MKTKETALSVQNPSTIAVKTEPAPAPSVPKQPEQNTKKAKKKKNPFIVVLIILLVLLVLGAAGFFGYKYYMFSASKNILSALTGTWVYDTGTPDAGYIAFFGNDDVVVDGNAYSVSATKNAFSFKKDDAKLAVSYILNDDQLLLSLTEKNALLESCEMTISNTDAGVLLYRISDSYTLDTDLIGQAYVEQFPQYASITDALNGLLDWDALMNDYQNGDFDFGNITDYLPEMDSPEDVQDYLDSFSDFYSGITNEEADFDFSDLAGQFLSDYIGNFGDEAGDYVSDSLDGTEAEDLAESLYDFWQYFQESSEEDSAMGELWDNLFSW